MRQTKKTSLVKRKNAKCCKSGPSWRPETKATSRSTSHPSSLPHTLSSKPTETMASKMTVRSRAPRTRQSTWQCTVISTNKISSQWSILIKTSSSLNGKIGNACNFSTPIMFGCSLKTADCWMKILSLRNKTSNTKRIYDWPDHSCPKQGRNWPDSRAPRSV